MSDVIEVNGLDEVKVTVGDVKLALLEYVERRTGKRAYAAVTFKLLFNQGHPCFHPLAESIAMSFCGVQMLFDGGSLKVPPNDA